MKHFLKTYGIVALLLFIAAGLFLYPSLGNLYQSLKHRTWIRSYREEVATTSQDTTKRLEDARTYNKELSPLSVTSKKDKENYETQLSLSPGSPFGVVEIPKLSLSLPIFHGTKKETLDKGVGHLCGTDLPIGADTEEERQVGRHSALSAHTGSPASKLFTELDQLKKGDTFSVTVLETTRVYEVTDIKVVLPVDVEGLKRQPGKDQVTLVTCTPYGVNSHRLLVTGDRTEGRSDNSVAAHLPKDPVWQVGLAGFVLLSLVWLVYRSRSRRKNKQNK